MSDLFSVIQQMQQAGLGGLHEGDLIVDGKHHRYRPEGAKNKTAWYALHEFVTRRGKTIIVGAFGDWRLQGANGKPISFKIEPLREALSDDERDQLKKEIEKNRRQQEKQRREKAKMAREKALRAWSSSKLFKQGTSDYLQRKGVKGYGVRYNKDGHLFIPMYDVGGALHGLQVIYAKSKERTSASGDLLEKDFWPFSVNPIGHFHYIGPEPEKEASGRVRIVICEGYATGASIYEATGLPVYVAFNVGNLLPVAQALRAVDPDVEIIIAADDDYLTTRPPNPGKTTANLAAKKVGGRVVLPVFKNRNGEKWTDFNDLHKIEGLAAVSACFTQSTKDWKYRLSTNMYGQIKADLNNVFLILLNDERWRGVLRYDRFTYDVIKIKPPPFEFNAKTGEWTESDTSRLQCWMADHYEFTPKENDALKAVIIAAETQGYHPVLDYLHGLKWDGTPRLATWLSDYLGAAQSEYTAAAGTFFLIGAVARAHAEIGRPVKMDNVLILEGAQGLGKSTAIAILARPWSADTHFALGSKDGYQQLRGVWVYEVAELDAFNKAESEAAKAFFSATEDNYRPSYGKRSMKFPRQAVFVGTTNKKFYLKDVTGNRRYWPVWCAEINFKLLHAMRDQLWAEALHRYRAGETWHVPEELKDIFEAEQSARFQSDEIESEVIEWLYKGDGRTRNELTGAEIMREALGWSTDKMTPPNQVRLGLIMQRLGWDKKQKRDENRRVYKYVRPIEDRLNETKPDDPM